MSPRHDTVPGAAGAVLAAVAAAGLAAQYRRHRRVLRGHGDEAIWRTGAGNLLAYRFTEPRGEAPLPGAPGPPALVFEPGMVSTAAHWSWWRRAFQEEYAVLSYDRAGYGRSSRRDRRDFTLASAVADLADLVRGVCGDRQVILVGHSLGGYLALRALEPLAGQVTGVVLLDPSHPEELRRSAAQARGAESLQAQLAMLPLSVRLGLGWMLPTPSWLSRLPEDERPIAGDQYRDRKMWAAAVREWRATYREFRGGAVLPPLTVPVALVAAHATHRQDPAHAALHTEIVAAAPDGALLLIDGVEHDELLLSESACAETAQFVRRFVTRCRPSAEGSQDRAEASGEAAVPAK
ncbi:alpha/beta fold hydrolase [Streptomyces sp. NPDC059008]|uniref:alpha/beta fold hydrolase n=1 Tax=Streptomyces sp. NPDC059008 TaxID=3346693 RepID=UPI00368BB469